MTFNSSSGLHVLCIGSGEGGIFSCLAEFKVYKTKKERAWLGGKQDTTSGLDQVREHGPFSFNLLGGRKQTSA